MKLDLRVVLEKGSGIDAQKVAADQAKRSAGALKRIGGYILKTARNSIKSATASPTSPGRLTGDMRIAAEASRNLFGKNPVLRRSSIPGRQPKSWSGNLKAGMNFQVDGQTVVVGAVKYKQDGARLLEHGGQAGDLTTSPYKRLGLHRMRTAQGIVVGVLSRDGSELIIGSPRLPVKQRVRSVTTGSLLRENRVRRARQSARPFMGPALTKTQSKPSEYFRG